MLLKDLFDAELFREHLVKNHVSEMRHPEFKELAIYNYTHVCQHDNIWDNVTEQCRGLIVNTETGVVLARPFRKFFNLNTSFRSETQEENLLTGKPTVLEKLDGSLGILYLTPENVPTIATRGSFVSDQARWANVWYQNHLSARMGTIRWPAGYTPLFEIIYKENRIVVDYGEFEGLVLLGLVNIDTGFEVPHSEVVDYAAFNGFRSAKTFPFDSLSLCKSNNVSNTEGFVLQYWPNETSVPLRIKIKTEEYTRLHKIITGMNPKGIWEHLAAGAVPDAIWANTTPQFTEWALGWIRTFKGMYQELEHNALLSFGEIYADVSEKRVAIEQSSGQRMDERALRKSYALAIQEKPVQYRSILFAILSGSGWKAQIWKRLEPKILGKEVSIRDADSFNGI